MLGEMASNFETSLEFGGLAIASVLLLNHGIINGVAWFAWTILVHVTI